MREINIPWCTSTQDLQTTGVTNCLEELLSAQRLGQFHWLRSTDQGRTILRNLGYSADSPPSASQEERCLSLEHLAHITIAPLPKNVDPNRNSERCHVRTNVLSKALQRLGSLKHVYYVDANPGEDERRFTAVVGPLSYELVTIEPDVDAIDDLETRFIAWAIYAATTHIARPQTPIIIVTDSQAASEQLIRNDLHHRTARLMKDALD